MPSTQSATHLASSHLNPASQLRRRRYTRIYAKKTGRCGVFATNLPSLRHVHPPVPTLHCAVHTFFSHVNPLSQIFTKLKHLFIFKKIENLKISFNYIVWTTFATRTTFWCTCSIFRTASGARCIRWSGAGLLCNACTNE